MTAYQIRKTTPEPVRKRPTKDKGYLAWLHELPCCISGREGVQAAHVSTAAPMMGHYGRGKSQKAPDRWAIPLTPELHELQHKHGEDNFWKVMASRRKIFPKSPHMIACILYGIYCEHGYEDGIQIARRVIASWV